MYKKPQLTRFGTFRDLTQASISGDTDGFWVCGVPCDDNGAPGPAEPELGRSQ